MSNNKTHEYGFEIKEMDEDFYVASEEGEDVYYVFGYPSGFAYASYLNKDEAKEKAKEMVYNYNNRKA